MAGPTPIAQSFKEGTLVVSTSTHSPLTHPTIHPTLPNVHTESRARVHQSSWHTLFSNLPTTPVARALTVAAAAHYSCPQGSAPLFASARELK